jgi:two-component system, response regulator PdtaR
MDMHDMAQRNESVVLVVEDETIRRLQTVFIIEKAGFNVVEASNADEAIAILETREDIRVVVTDIEMPGSMDGIKLARAIRDRWPPIELIVTSGRHRVRTGELPPRAKFMPKPYRPDVLVTVIRTLDSRP